MAEIGSILTGAGATLGGIGGLFDDTPEQQLKLQKQMMEREWQKWALNRLQQRSDLGAQREYLEGNLPEFQGLTDYKFDPSKFADIIEPMKARADKGLLATRNLAALQGRGRGGQVLTGMGRQARGQAQDFNRMMTGLRRGDEQSMYERALQKYIQDANRAKTIAGTVTGEDQASQLAAQQKAANEAGFQSGINTIKKTLTGSPAVNLAKKYLGF
jgi:hypothetical protein